MHVEDEDAVLEFGVEERDGAVGQDAEVTAELKSASGSDAMNSTVATRRERFSNLPWLEIHCAAMRLEPQRSMLSSSRARGFDGARLLRVGCWGVGRFAGAANNMIARRRKIPGMALVPIEVPAAIAAA